jgi:Predicted Zn-dependent protease (DUF2268)
MQAGRSPGSVSAHPRIHAPATSRSGSTRIRRLACARHSRRGFPVSWRTNCTTAAGFEPGPGYGVTLGQALVSEGLADHFASEVFPDTPSRPCDHALTRAQERSLWLVARRVLNIPFGYDHWEWFFGAGTIPRWAGYTLGYEIVGQYLSHRRTAADAVHVDAAKVIAPFHGF